MSSRLNRIDYLDGIRAMAIMSVVAVHWLEPYLHVGLGGYIGVDIFFVLSGFIITTILWRNKSEGSVAVDWIKFIWKRVKRLYPALIGLVVFVPLLCLILPLVESPREAARQGLIAVTQLSSLWEGSESGSLGPFGPTWSLAVEWYFYLVWAVVVLVVKQQAVPAHRMATLTAILAGAIYGFSLFQSDHWFYFGPVARFAELLIGGAVGLWLLGRREVWTVSPAIRSWGPVAAVAALMAYVILGPVEWHPLARFLGVPLTVACTVALIILGRSHVATPMFRLLGSRPVTMVGRTSYSFYLWHMIPIALMGGNFLGLSKPILGVIGVIFAFVATAASYLLLERPFMGSRSDALAPRPAKELAGARRTSG